VALYHPLTEAELGDLCDRFRLRLQSAEGVPQGSINTNYRLTCDQGRYFLRFTTVRSQAELDFEASLLFHLKRGGFPCAEPLRTREGSAYSGYQAGWVSIFQHLAGEELGPEAVTADHASEIGRALGRLHRLGSSFEGQRENPYGEATIRHWLGDLVSRDLADDIAAAVRGAGQTLPAASVQLGLPRGAIHGDLFRDNVKWLDGRVSGIFDFEMACVDDLALDVGITLLVWTFGADAFDRPRVRALLDGYQRERKLLPEERSGLYTRATFGAVRYTLSRIRDFHLAQVGASALTRKPWQRYAQRLEELKRLGPEAFAEICGW
jgi:homoserine kinase type II